MMRHIASVVAGILVLIPTWVAAGTCDAVLSKTLQGTRTGTYFNQTNNSKIRNVPKDEEFDFEILTSVRNGGCPGTGGNKCLISGTKGQQAALITMKQAPAGSPSLTVNSGEIVHLGSWLLSGNATHEYNTITVNSGGTVYFWGGDYLT